MEPVSALPPEMILLVLGGVAALAVVALMTVVIVGRMRRRRLLAELADAGAATRQAELVAAEQGARMRMATELLDVSISSVSTIIRHAEGARFKAERDPAAAARAAVQIADTARETRAELRRVANAVRQEAAAALPQPGVETALDLFDIMREAGLGIRFEELGERFPLRHGAEVAVFRIMQEALTNALKHGGEGTEVRVSLRWSDTGVNVLVDDDGIRAATRREGQDPNRVARAGGYTIDEDAAALTTTPEGRGITEMRERAELFGGTFTAYTVPGVGFSVAVAFPHLRQDSGVSASEN